MSAAFDLLGILAGLIALVLGIVVIVEEHKGSPMLQRFALGGLVFACFLVVVDGFGHLATFGVDLTPSPFGGLFCLLLAFNWTCRLMALGRKRRSLQWSTPTRS
jgi:hypothetical protein